MAVPNRPATSWGSVLGGWLAAVGALALFVPAGALLVGAATPAPDSPLLAVPVIFAVFVAYLIGGYVAGRLAGERRSWHGLMSAVWGILVALVAGLIAGGVSSANGVALTIPNVDVTAYPSALTFGAILGFLVALLGGWLGGVVAPSSVMKVAAPATGPILARPHLREIVGRKPSTDENGAPSETETEAEKEPVEAPPLGH